MGLLYRLHTRDYILLVLVSLSLWIHTTTDREPREIRHDDFHGKHQVHIVKYYFQNGLYNISSLTQITRTIRTDFYEKVSTGVRS